ncbi:uncharacterized protein LOC143882928 [Tasmannia lanceolata]|uniref:uncharacterized protein LOC143882928 n=1 Tax=Tasmannia lanceolata TaxID=3420 RepID=UPI0040646781
MRSGRSSRLLFFSLSSPSSSISPSSESIPNAVEILFNSGFTSMALTLQLTSQTLIPESSSTTIFSPSDDAFISSGQPSRNPLLNHSQDLSLFFFLIPIPQRVLSYVSRTKSRTSILFQQIQSRNFLRFPLRPILHHRIFAVRFGFHKSSIVMEALKQLIVKEQDPDLNGGKKKVTIFFGTQTDPCQSGLTWTDLDLLNNESELQTLSKEFSINVTRSGDILVLYGIPVIFSDMYCGELLVVHGLRQVLTAQVYLNQSDDSFSGIHG